MRNSRKQVLKPRGEDSGSRKSATLAEMKTKGGISEDKRQNNQESLIEQALEESKSTS